MKNVKMIFGPPGTGKTYKLLDIMEKELERVHPNEIAFVSYTKKGSYEGKERAKERFNLRDEDLPYFRTLHSIAFQKLKLSRQDVINKTHYKQFSTALDMKFMGYYTEDLKHNDDAYLFFDGLQRNNPKMAKFYMNILDTLKLNFVQTNYLRFKQVMGIIDFTDMITMFIEQKIKLPVKVAIVDEAQDLTTLQWKMVLTAFRNCDRLYLAGDDDQAIYEWNGADVNFFLNFKGIKQLEILNRSYRLPNNIIKYACSISKNIKNRVAKNYTSEKLDGKIKIITSLEELSIDNYTTWLFLSRNNYYLAIYKKYFEEKGIRYLYKGVSSVNQSEIDAIRTYTMLKRLKSKENFRLKLHLKKDFKFENEWYDSFKWPIEKIIYYRNLIKNKNLHVESINVFIETIHSIKGGEADNVVIMENITKNVKSNLDKNPDCEHRIFYTGVTRTKQNLYILQADTKYFYDLRRQII